MKVQLTKSVKGILAESSMADEMPSQELEAGETLTVTGRGEYVLSQPTATVVDHEGLSYFVMLDKLLEAIPEDDRPKVGELVDG